jgi:hypothetical protein
VRDPAMARIRGRVCCLSTMVTAMRARLLYVFGEVVQRVEDRRGRWTRCGSPECAAEELRALWKEGQGDGVALEVKSERCDPVEALGITDKRTLWRGLPRLPTRRSRMRGRGREGHTAQKVLI